ncbi:hypothetical protein ACTHQ4_10125 [Alkalicoccobacillus gibsonii]|uniref:hypothetical protein n=1 Tax=Alkalicoccobacillus gibsonii TaxID=79881 RepID=UPI003F7C70D7
MAISEQVTKGKTVDCTIVELLDPNGHVAGYEITDKSTGETTVRMLEVDYDHEGKMEYETPFL